MAIFPGGPGLAGTRISVLDFVGTKDGGCGSVTGVIRCAKLQSNHHHQQTNIYLFTRQTAFLLPDQPCQSTEGTHSSQPIVTTIISCVMQYLRGGLHTKQFNTYAAYKLHTHRPAQERQHQQAVS